MAKLYPPQIEGILPAFYGNTLTIPFTMNTAVSASNVNGIAVRIKHAQNGDIIFNGTTGFTYDSSSSIQKITIEEDFKNFIIGNYYKIQIAYIDGEEIGYYSSIGVAKYTATPKVELVLTSNKITGKYTTDDVTEKVYFYTFNLYDENTKELLISSGQKIHNTDNDEIITNNGKTQYISYDSFDNDIFINSRKTLVIEYKIQTNNLLELTKSDELTTQTDEIFNEDISGSIDYNNGLVQISVVSNSTSINKYRIIKSEINNSSGLWNSVSVFNMGQGEKININDFNVVQGQTYYYTILPDGQNIVNTDNSRLLITADYEDMFLFDGERQLRICYNPKVSSFKTTLLETKTNTIGGKYPFIFRNGQVGYKEFQISGLISYLSDENGYFAPELNVVEKTIYREATSAEISKAEAQSNRTTNLTSENFKKEREFKQEVLSWLTNGKPKIFKSPAEGNYIVNLTGVSLSPNDTLGRMLHTFTCTASEIAEYNNENLIKYNFIKTEV